MAARQRWLPNVHLQPAFPPCTPDFPTPTWMGNSTFHLSSKHSSQKPAPKCIGFASCPPTSMSPLRPSQLFTSLHVHSSCILSAGWTFPGTIKVVQVVAQKQNKTKQTHTHTHTKTPPKPDNNNNNNHRKKANPCRRTLHRPNSLV